MDFRLHAEVKRYQDGYLSYRQIVDILHDLTKKANVCGFNLAEFVPEKDVSGLTASNMVGTLV
jgi:arginase family enzyme